jgi:hypothetical protein
MRHHDNDSFTMQGLNRFLLAIANRCRPPESLTPLSPTIV